MPTLLDDLQLIAPINEELLLDEGITFIMPVARRTCEQQRSSRQLAFSIVNSLFSLAQTESKIMKADSNYLSKALETYISSTVTPCTILIKIAPFLSLNKINTHFLSENVLNILLISLPSLPPLEQNQFLRWISTQEMALDHMIEPAAQMLSNPNSTAMNPTCLIFVLYLNSHKNTSIARKMIQSILNANITIPASKAFDIFEQNIFWLKECRPVFNFLLSALDSTSDESFINALMPLHV